MIHAITLAATGIHSQEQRVGTGRSAREEDSFPPVYAIDPNQSRDFHPAVLLIWWAR